MPPRLQPPGLRIALGSALLAALLLLGAAAPASPQEAVDRILEQDSTLNNLVDPPGYRTGEPGALGDVDRAGEGPTPMVLVPGLGFAGEVFDALVERWRERYTMYRVTLPGFGGTPAPPAPPEGTSFGEQTWTNGALEGLEALLEAEALDEVVVVGHWLTGTQLALRLAMRNPDRVRAVALLAGSARWVQAGAPEGEPPPEIPLERRVAQVDDALAPDWFRTVTRETWDDNNFLPGDYAAHPVLGLRLWRRAARPPLHVWVRYLCEFFAQDVTLELDRLETPTLLLEPDLEGAYQPPGNRYLDAYVHGSWRGVVEAIPELRARTLSGTRVVPWADRPDAVADAVEAFLAETGVEGGAGPQGRSGARPSMRRSNSGR